MTRKGFALVESILLFAGAILICTAIISSLFSSEHFKKAMQQMELSSHDEVLESLYEN